ncbi:hypothetical protein Lal_00037791 [Lupinus albus]|nr:hypothetical protein Lal_00037791 [Lupinus albus]
MSISHPFELIRDLNDSKYMWKIVVRIIYIWYVQLLLKPGHMEMILMDCKDRQCVDIIEIMASELRNQMVAEGEDVPKAFPLTLDMLLARTMTLRVKVQPSYNQSSMIRLSENPTLINSIAGQFGLLELHNVSE